MPYAGLVDLVGVRELASEEPDRYVGHSLSFRTALEQEFEDCSGTRVYFFRDHCYVEAQTRKTLFSALAGLRRNLLLHSDLHIRATVAVGEIGGISLQREGVVPRRASKPKANKRSGDWPATFSGFAFNELAARLFGELEAFKGIGISIDADLLLKEADVAASLVENFFITEGRAHRYHSFLDLRLDDASMVRELLSKTLRNFRQSRAASKKVARFFVPTLTNWARSMNMSAGTEATLDEALVAGRLNGFRDVTGIELVYLTLIDRVYSKEAEQFANDRVVALREFFLNATWIHSLLRSHDYNKAPIPKSVLSNTSRRAFINEVAEFERRAGRARRPVDVSIE